MMPCTLEGAVVRLSDIIAYLGKDRQDAARAKMAEESVFSNEDIGSINAEIINNLVVNVIDHGDWATSLQWIGAGLLYTALTIRNIG
jgi:dGTPase